MQPKYFRNCLSGCGIFVWLCLFHPQAYGVNYGVNLIVNGDAEAGPAASPVGAPITPPGWTTTGGFTVVAYGTTGGYPSSTDPGPPDRGQKFFAGGNAATSSVFQTIDVSANSADIDQDKVSCDVTAWLGGFSTDDDQATFTVTFKKDAFNSLGSVTLGPVTAADRNNVTALERLANTAPLPAQTRTLLISLVMTRGSGGGNFNDGYADSLSVILRAPYVVTTTADSGPGSLRAAVAAGNTITFDPAVFAAASMPHVISLLSELPPLNSNMTIAGPGKGVLTVRRSGAAGTPLFRIFTINGGTLEDGPFVTISGLTISNGNAGSLGGGGGAANNYGRFTFKDCTISGNSAFLGGGIYSAVELNNTPFRPVSLVLLRCSITGNVAVTDASRFTAAGGGLYTSYVHATVDQCAITGNSAPAGVGGGIYNFRGDVEMQTSTVSGNSANSVGGIVNDDGDGSGLVTASLALFACTVSDNGSAGVKNVNSNNHRPFLHFGGTIMSGPAPVLTLADPNSVSHCRSDGYNLFSDSTGSPDGLDSTDQIADPLLGPLQDNGGPTFTRALLPGSPAIDKGGYGRTIDQRGAPRPFDDPNSANGDSAADVGAFEFQGTPPVVLANISGRLPVGAGDNALFAGFIVTGYQPKKVIIRAIGPSLGVAGGLADPTLELRDGSGALLQSNDNWKDSPNKQAIIDSTIPPTNDLESAIVATLPASPSGTNYTAIVRGAGNATGIGVVEVYDLDRSLDSKLANISNRGFVQTGDNVLFAGDIVLGQAAQKVIIRALGPSVPVPGAMADPTLELRDANGSLLEANDNWVDSPNKQAIIDSTIPPTNNLESAIVRTLTPANYTAIVRGANNSTGIAVVEVYALN